MRVPAVTTDAGVEPDLPEGFRGRATLTEDGDYLLVPEGAGQDERIAALEAEVRGMKDRAAAASVTGDAAKVRDSITGKP